MEAFCYEDYGHSGCIKAENFMEKLCCVLREIVLWAQRNCVVGSEKLCCGLREIVLWAQRNSRIQDEIVRHLKIS